MKIFSVMLLNASLLLSIGNLAFANPSAGNNTSTNEPPRADIAPISTPEQQADQRARRIPPRMQHMKEGLNLTPEQQGPWQKFEDTWIAQMKSILMQNQRSKMDTPMTTPERLQLQITHMEQRLDAMKKISAAQQALYQILTPQQRQIMDTKFGPEAKGSEPKAGMQSKPSTEATPSVSTNNTEKK